MTDISEIARDWSAVVIGDATRIRFDPVEATLTYTHHGHAVDLTSTVCEAKRSLAASGVGSVLVVGRFDHRELSRSARLRWSSNQALAQARADSVANYLEDPMSAPRRWIRLCGLSAVPSTQVVR